MGHRLEVPKWAEVATRPFTPNLVLRVDSPPDSPGVRRGPGPVGVSFPVPGGLSWDTRPRRVYVRDKSTASQEDGATPGSHPRRVPPPRHSGREGAGSSRKTASSTKGSRYFFIQATTPLPKRLILVFRLGRVGRYTSRQRVYWTMNHHLPPRRSGLVSHPRRERRPLRRGTLCPTCLRGGTFSADQGRSSLIVGRKFLCGPPTRVK